MNKANAERSKAQQRQKNSEDARTYLRLFIDSGASREEIKAERKAMVKRIQDTLEKPATNAISTVNPEIQENTAWSPLSGVVSNHAGDMEQRNSSLEEFADYSDVPRSPGRCAPRFENVSSLSVDDEEYKIE